MIVKNFEYDIIKRKNEQKFLYVNFSDVTYRVPIKYIAEHYANYYKEKHNEDFAENYDYIIRDESEIYDWVMSNMDWADLASFAEKVETEHPVVNYEQEWLNCNKYIA